MRTDAASPSRGVPAGGSEIAARPELGSAAEGGEPGDRRPSVAVTLAVLAVALVLVGAVVAVVVNALVTSSARVTASTSGDGLLTAGDVVLDRADTSAELFLDADGLYPGLEARGCVVVVYSGTVPVTIRLLGDPGSGTGLDEFVELRLELLGGTDCPPSGGSPEARAGDELYDGPLSALWSDHSDWSSALAVTAASPGDRLVIAATASVVDDNRAQGLATDFSLTVEGRPS